MSVAEKEREEGEGDSTDAVKADEEEIRISVNYWFR